MSARRTTSQGKPVLTMRINSDALLKAAGVTNRARTANERQIPSPHGKIPSGMALKPLENERAKIASQKGDPSIISSEGGCESSHSKVAEAADMSFVSQVLSSTGHKLAAAQKRFWAFALPDGHLLEPRHRDLLVKQAILAAQPSQSAAVPLAQAQAAMQSFLPGQPLQAGQGVRPTGLDGPSDTRAEALPGTPGHAATNVIDRQGGLDPRGMTVDGNNAAGVPKGFKMGSAQMPTVGDQLMDAVAALTAKQEKQAHVEPLPRWKNPPQQGSLDHEFLNSPGVQNLLTNLGMHSTADGQIRDGRAKQGSESCESSHSDVKEATALFRGSELSQLLA